jgi:hypothetical protein
MKDRPARKWDEVIFEKRDMCVGVDVEREREPVQDTSVRYIWEEYLQWKKAWHQACIDLGQTHPSMGQVGMGQKVNRLTDLSVEWHCVTLDFATMVRICCCCTCSTNLCIIW